VEHRDGPARSSEEVPVMGMEPRGWVIPFCLGANRKREELLKKARPCMAE
jgi:hypothetical protein